MIRVAVAGCAGRMGQAVVEAVTGAADMELVCGIDPFAGEVEAFPVFKDVASALEGATFDVMVDFTQPDVVEGNIRAALPAGVDCVIGTTGLSNAVLEEL
ncbi:MAG: 4-hydroxy-tetrahydrodipicolinate reductase, partial [Eggerthellaceae bacterium]|nr:4-hydroxy-tetrahydrodipicolinate reductase [Eggerthellaceae bacterium]